MRARVDVLRFDGRITGLGSESGTRCVVGRWDRSPYGRFADVMVERADGRRTLIAPSRAVADFVAATYRFDDVRVEPVTVDVSGRRVRVRTATARLGWTVGRPTLLGVVLGLVPRPLARSRRWTRLISPVARIISGSSTFGAAAGTRREWYCATGERKVAALDGELDGCPLGDLRPVAPPARFGFASTPARPSQVSVTTWVELTRD